MKSELHQSVDENDAVATTSKAQQTSSNSNDHVKTAASSSKRSLTHFYQLPSRKERELRSIYQKLDADGDGKIDIKELVSALKARMPADNARRYANEIMSLAAKNSAAKSTTMPDGTAQIDFAEFMHYVLEHEKRLALVFKDLDRNKDGNIDHKEVVTYFNSLGIHLSEPEAAKLVEKMDKDGNMSVDLDEFQNYLLFHPSFDPKDIASFWRHSLMIDIGESSLVPEDFSESEIKRGAWWRHLLAGACAGAVSRTSTAPLDRLKVYMQVHGSKNNNLSVMFGMRTLLDEGGVKSLWRGNGVNVIKIAPEQAIKFMTYEQLKRLIKGNSTKDLAVYERLMAGSAAGAISQTCIYPLEVLKTRLALRKSGEMNRGLWKAGCEIFRKEGLRAFYRGYIPNTIGILPYAGIDLAVYETLKKLYMKTHEIPEPGIFALLACGTISSTCGQLSSYPLALVRTRLQALSISGHDYQPNTMRGQFKYIVQNDGFTGLYRGLTPNFMKVLPAVSISYVVYESVRKQLGVEMT